MASDVGSWGSRTCLWGRVPSKSDRALRTMLVTREMEAYDFTATRDFHSTYVCSVMGYWNIGTQGVRSGSEMVLASFRMGIYSVTKPLLQHIKDVSKVIASLPCRVGCRRSQIARCPMHVACAGCVCVVGGD